MTKSPKRRVKRPRPTKLRSQFEQRPAKRLRLHIEQPEIKPETLKLHIESEPEIIWGAEAISKLINRSTMQTYHLLEQGYLKGAQKIRSRWSARRPVLLSQWDADQQGGGR